MSEPKLQSSTSREIKVVLVVDRDSKIDMPKILASLEYDLIVAALGAAGGVKGRAAVLLGINRTTIVMKMKKYDLPLLPPAQRKKKESVA